MPIHHDETFARASGYEAPLVIGMYPAAALTTWAAELFGPTTVRETRIRWNAMVWQPDVWAKALRCTEQTSFRLCRTMDVGDGVSARATWRKNATYRKNDSRDEVDERLGRAALVERARLSQSELGDGRVRA